MIFVSLRGVGPLAKVWWWGNCFELCGNSISPRAGLNWVAYISEKLRGPFPRTINYVALEKKLIYLRNGKFCVAISRCAIMERGHGKLASTRLQINAGKSGVTLAINNGDQEVWAYEWGKVV